MERAKKINLKLRYGQNKGYISNFPLQSYYIPLQRVSWFVPYWYNIIVLLLLIIILLYYCIIIPYLSLCSLESTASVLSWRKAWNFGWSSFMFSSYPLCLAEISLLPRGVEVQFVLTSITILSDFHFSISMNLQAPSFWVTADKNSELSGL